MNANPNLASLLAFRPFRALAQQTGQIRRIGLGIVAKELEVLHEITPAARLVALMVKTGKKCHRLHQCRIFAWREMAGAAERYGSAD